MDCPCGCGRGVKFTKKGSAKGYIEAVEALEFFDQFAASGWDDDPQAREAMLMAGGLARELPRAFAAHIHGEARPGSTPDVLTLAQQLRSNRDLVVAFGNRFG